MKKRIVFILVLWSMLMLLFGCGTDKEVEAVIDGIKNLGYITVDSENSIISLETAYDALTDEQKTEVTNYSDLISARKELDSAIETANAEKEFQKMLDSINAAVNDCMLKNGYSSITAAKDHSVITIKVKTEDYIWDDVQKDSSLKQSYKSDFSAIYKAALSATKDYDNVPQIDIVAVEPNGDSLATGQGTSDVRFLFE